MLVQINEKLQFNEIMNYSHKHKMYATNDRADCIASSDFFLMYFCGNVRQLS